MSAASAAPSLLELRGITKAFPGVLANDRVDLSILPGEIHALLGENGAGKSTLVQIIYGVLKADAGELRWRGAPVEIASPAAARRLGIGMVFQHFALFEALSVAENIELGLEEKVDRRSLRRRIVEISQTYGLPLDPERSVHPLSVGERQRVEIVRCLLQNPRLLIMDEPTSVLTPQEADKLFETLRRLAGEGCSILYISHKLEEIKALCERATIMRLGRVVAETDPRQETAKRLAELMIGETLRPAHKRPADKGPVRLEVEALSLPSEETFGTSLANIGFTVHAGEILGIGGIAGNGQGELMAALIGERRCARAETIRLDGVPIGRFGPTTRRRRGMAFVPEERNGHAAVAGLSLADNGLLSARHRDGMIRHGLIDGAATARYAARVIERFDVRTRGPDAEARSLSGGNLQKFVVGREMLQQPQVLVVNQPTWGVDAGAAAAIHQALLDLADAGAAVLVISQDLDEIFALCDRIAVIAEGRLSAARPIAEASIEEIGLLMGGGRAAQTPPAPRETAANA